MKIKSLLLAFSFISAITYAQNVGINTPTPEAALDINGDVIIRTADLTVGDGITLSLDINTTRFSNYRITGPAADFTIAGIAAGIDGRLISLFNRSGFGMQINNEDPTAAVGETIVTGTGADMIIPNKGVLNLQYDATEQQWIVRSSSKGGGSVSGGYWDSDGTHIYNNNTGNIAVGTSTALSNTRLTIQTPLSYSGWTHTASTIIVDEAIGGVSASLGTKTNTTFRLKTNDQGRLHILDDGRVIISPNNYQPFGQFTVHTLTSGYGISHTDGDVVISTYAGGIPARGYVGTQSDHPLSFYTNGGGSQMILLQNGNIGIGNSNPTAKFHLTGNQKIDGTNTIEFGAGLSKETNAGKIGYQTFTAGTLDIVGAGTSTGNRKIKFWSEGGSTFAGGASFTGNVGIGTTNPSFPLSVNGTIQSKEVRVETGWADFVFEENYKLVPLAEVEKFIKANKHLPGIPSAKEIQDNGLALGEVQTKMMQKIEELTLYIIELEKQIKGLKENKK